MGLFDKLLKKELPVYVDTDVVAVGTGELVKPEKLSDPIFKEEMMGQTVGFELTDGTVVAPCNGTLEVVFPTGHAFAIRTKDGKGLLVHIGVDTVNMNGDGFKVLKKQGDEVKVGETVVKVDLNKVKNAGYDSTIMLVVTEGDKINYTSFGPVTKGQKIN